MRLDLWVLIVVVFMAGWGWGAWFQSYMALRVNKGRVTVSAPFSEAQADKIMKLATDVSFWFERQKDESK